jgi:hypothetical protein
VYFSLWGTDDMEEKLKDCGLSNPKVIAVRVDETEIQIPQLNKNDEDETPTTATANNKDQNELLLASGTCDSRSGIWHTIQLWMLFLGGVLLIVFA